MHQQRRIMLHLISITSLVILTMGSSALWAEKARNQLAMKEAKPISTTVKNYTFGHSLVVHQPENASSSDKTSILHWMALLAKHSGYQYYGDGQWGFMLQHTNQEPISQWGFKQVKSAWKNSFTKSQYSHVMFTDANFIQYKGPEETYDGDNPSRSTPVSLALKLIDRTHKQSPDAVIYIYENWPDMGYMDFPPPKGKLLKYHRNTADGDFHQWWIKLHDKLRAERPEVSIKMIPVGPIIAKLLTDTELKNIPVTELYEDSAPHGRPTIYFLGGLVTFMAMYGVPPADGFEVPADIHKVVRENFSNAVDLVWQELQNFNDSQGISRVW